MDAFASIAELGKALRAKKVSSVELAHFYLDRLNTKGREYGAVAELTESLAMKQAKAADERFASGSPIGPLDGIPFGVKDLCATNGIPTRWGSPGHSDQVFRYDGTMVERLQNAGGVLVAKLAMIELAGGGNYDIAAASATGAGLCAWDKTKWAGGSSSGSGAATALGCVPYSLGSETAGSIVCPSAFNGLTGFRPSYGRVSRHGAMALCWTLDRVGPIARSVDDAALALAAIAGQDPLDPTTVAEKMSLRSRGAKPKIGMLKEDFKGNKADVCAKAYAETIVVLQKAGYEFVDVEYPDMPYGVAIGIIVDAEGASAHENFIRGERFQTMADIHQVAGLAAALETKAVDYLWAMRLKQQALKANAVWQKCDAIISPTFYHGAPSAQGSLNDQFALYGGDNGPSNLLGWPAISFMNGFEGVLPLGMTVMAPCLREDICYRIAKDYQRETDWHKKHPSG